MIGILECLAAALPYSRPSGRQESGPGSLLQDRRRIFSALIEDKVDSGGRLVDAAGETMHDIVSSVKRASDIMNEIAAASAEQSAGIEQVNEAVGQMDEMTQQNAALVEESAAAAETLHVQARQLTKLINSFRLISGAGESAALTAGSPHGRPRPSEQGSASNQKRARAA